MPAPTTGPALVLTFDRHPAELLAPERAPGYLTTPAQRSRLIAELGADALIIARFDRSLSERSPDDFVRAVFCGTKLGAEAIVEGRDFCFGKDRAGQSGLSAPGFRNSFGFTVHALDPVSDRRSSAASSSRIRE